MMDKTKALDKLLNAHSHHYDIARDVQVEGGSFPAAAFYYLRDENYLVTKKHILNVVENYEYIYFYLTEHLTAAQLEEQITLSRQVGMGHIRPSKVHMSSAVGLVVLADVIDEEAKRLIRKTRFRKNFLFSFHGWMEYRVAAMECSTHTILSNFDGKGIRKTMELNFSAKVS
jgi:hypothetical protein